MKNIKITCDNCGRDLTYTTNSVDWRIAVINESVYSKGGAVTDMYIEPFLPQNYHFCGVDCLKAFFNKGN